MAKTSTLEDQLSALRVLKERDPASISDAEVATLLASKHSSIAAAAAAFAGEQRRAELIPKLRAAFTRFAADGAKNDKGCLAKLAIVNALCALDHRDADVYLRGIHIKQMEASWGKPVDTAGELRGRCAESLVVCLAPNALIDIAAMLADDEPQARVGAVRAAAMSPGEGGPALLRLKLATGDTEPTVLLECCAGLLRADADLHAPFVAAFLKPADTEIARAALDALAESRSPAVLRALQQAYDNAITAGERQSALEAIARLRVDGAAEYLLDLIEKALHPRAREVVESITTKKQDTRFLQRFAEALERRDDKFLERYAAEVLSRQP